jgi:hypothetical protein
MMPMKNPTIKPIIMPQHYTCPANAQGTLLHN